MTTEKIIECIESVTHGNEITFDGLTTRTRWDSLRQFKKENPKFFEDDELNKEPEIIDLEGILKKIKLKRRNIIRYEQSGNGWFLTEYNEFIIDRDGEEMPVTVSTSYDTFDKLFNLDVTGGITFSHDKK